MSIHRRWKLLLCCKSVLILFSNFFENCGIFRPEIGFLKALYMYLSQMINILTTHFLLDSISVYLLSTHMKRHSSVPLESWLVSVMMKHLV